MTKRGAISADIHKDENRKKKMNTNYLIRSTTILLALGLAVACGEPSRPGWDGDDLGEDTDGFGMNGEGRDDAEGSAGDEEGADETGDSADDSDDSADDTTGGDDDDRDDDDDGDDDDDTGTGGGGEGGGAAERETVQLRSRANGECLAVHGASQSLGARVSYGSCPDVDDDSQPHKRLLVRPLGNGFVELEFEHSSECLAVADGSISNGAGYVQETCNTSAPETASDSREFILDELADGFIKLRPKHMESKCAELWLNTWQEWNWFPPGWQTFTERGVSQEECVVDNTYQEFEYVVVSEEI